MEEVTNTTPNRSGGSSRNTFCVVYRRQGANITDVVVPVSIILKNFIVIARRSVGCETLSTNGLGIPWSLMITTYAPNGSSKRSNKRYGDDRVSRSRQVDYAVLLLKIIIWILTEGTAHVYDSALFCR